MKQSHPSRKGGHARRIIRCEVRHSICFQVVDFEQKHVPDRERGGNRTLNFL